MAFPTTSQLTDFTGSDEAPLSEGGKWSGPTQSGQMLLQRISNAAAPSQTANTGPSQGYRTDISTENTEAWVTLTASSIANDGVAVWARLQNPGHATNAAAYLAVWTQGIGFRIFRYDADHPTDVWLQKGSTEASVTAWADVLGGQLGIEVNGTSVALYYKPSGGSWTQKIQVTDSDVTGAGTIALELNSGTTVSGMRCDNFGGGQIVVGSTPHIDVTIGA